MMEQLKHLEYSYNMQDATAHSNSELNFLLLQMLPV